MKPILYPINVTEEERESIKKLFLEARERGRILKTSTILIKSLRLYLKSLTKK